MKKIIWSVLLILSTSQVQFGQTKEIYTHPQFDSIAKDHAILSILPFNVTIRLRPRQMKKLEVEEFKRIEKTEGFAVQSALHTYFLKQKEKENFKANLQDISYTNALLEKAGWTSDSLKSKTMSQICKLLETDGVISGTVETNKPLSDGASLALGVISFFAFLGTGQIGGGGSTNSGKATINVHEGKTNELLWKYEKKLSRGLGSDINSIINAMMRKASKKFPYEDIK